MRSRSFVALVVWLAILPVLAGCGEDPASPPTVHVQNVDAQPAWSHDGSMIAFVRSEWSTLGPPGLYLMNHPSGSVRLLSALDPHGLRGLRFTGYDANLIAGWNGALYVFDIGSGRASDLRVDATSAELPDETSNGVHIAYVRPGSTTGTLWHFATPDGDSLILIDGAPSFGTYPRFSPGDSLLAYVENDGIHVLNRWTGHGTRITTSNYPQTYHTVPRWLDEQRILFNEVSSSGQKYYVVDRSTGTWTEVPLGIFDSEAISPQGDSIVVQGFDQSNPDTARVVLFLRGIASPGSTARQITSFVPAPATPSSTLVDVRPPGR